MSSCSSGPSASCQNGKDMPWEVDLSKSKSRIIRSVLVLKGELGPEAIKNKGASAWYHSSDFYGPSFLSLQFKPWFVNRAYYQWLTKLHLDSYDRLMLLMDTATWAACLFTVPRFTWSQLYVVTCFLSCVAVTWFRARHVDVYNKHRSVFTGVKRMLCVPFIKLPHQLAKAAAPSSTHWGVIFWHLGIQTGAVFSAGLPFFFFDMWHLSALQSVATFVLIANTAAPACTHLIAQQDPAVTETWQWVAGLFNKATMGLYQSSMQQPNMTQATCMATANVLQVLAACASLSLLYWVEWGYRLRYKETLLPAIQRMQQHLGRQSAPLFLAQVLGLVLYPVVAVTWLLAGAWYGLRPTW